MEEGLPVSGEQDLGAGALAGGLLDEPHGAVNGPAVGVYPQKVAGHIGSVAIPAPHALADDVAAQVRLEARAGLGATDGSLV